MRTQTQRRYAQKDKREYTIYSDYFDRFLMKSDILNPTNLISGVDNFYDRAGVENCLYGLIGDKDGYVKGTVKATIPYAKELLDFVHDLFAKFVQEKVNQGHQEPTEWPIYLLTQRLRGEAIIDVFSREVEALANRLTELNKKVEIIEDENSLIFGPCGGGRLHDGLLVELDGQRIAQVDDMPVIMNGPYKGMRVADYRKFISEPWSVARKKFMSERSAAIRKEIVETGKQTLSEIKWQVPIDKSTLPPWPKGCINYLENRPPEKVEMVRTKHVKL